jgi:hypothetical protein
MPSSKIQLHRGGAKRLCIAALCLLCLWSTIANAQQAGLTLHASLVPLPSPYLSDWQTNPDIVRVQLANNSRQIAAYRLRVEIHGETHGFVASGESPLMQQAPFSQTLILGPEMIDWSNIQYNGKLRRQILQTGRIPEDDYELCVTTIGEGGQELAKSCTPFQVQRVEPITLISPADGDSIAAASPAFVWAPSQSTYERQASYQLRLVEVLPGQTPEEAMQSNFLHFESLPLQASFLAPEAGAFEEGKRYAWQVRQLRGDGELVSSDESASEIWSFIILSAKHSHADHEHQHVTQGKPRYSTLEEFHAGLEKAAGMIQAENVVAYLDTLRNGYPNLRGRTVPLVKVVNLILDKLNRGEVEAAVHDVYHFDGATFSLISFLMKAQMAKNISAKTLTEIIAAIPLPPIPVAAFQPPVMPAPMPEPVLICACKPKVKILVTWTYEPPCGNYKRTTSGYAARNTLTGMPRGTMFRFDAEVEACGCGGSWTSSVTAPAGASYGYGSSPGGDSVTLISNSSGTFTVTFTYTCGCGCGAKDAATFTISFR